MTPLVVYHAAAMGPQEHHRGIISEQLRLLAEVELKEIVLTHVGDDLRWITDLAGSLGLDLRVAFSDPDVNHCERPAIFEIERLAKGTERPILYLHTKGASRPGYKPHQRWRWKMHETFIRPWKEHLPHLQTHDAVGFNWFTAGTYMQTNGHFAGNFWMTMPAWLRTLRDFTEYNRTIGDRGACETWIATNHAIRPYTVGGTEIIAWNPNFDWDKMQNH